MIGACLEDRCRYNQTINNYVVLASWTHSVKRQPIDEEGSQILQGN